MTKSQIPAGDWNGWVSVRCNERVSQFEKLQSMQIDYRNRLPTFLPLSSMSERFPGVLIHQLLPISLHWKLGSHKVKPSCHALAQNSEPTRIFLKVFFFDLFSALARNLFSHKSILLSSHSSTRLDLTSLCLALNPKSKNEISLL
jgi:hypothetical protein